MPRGEERAGYSVFVPKLSINRSSESLHARTASDRSENEHRLSVGAGEDSQGWRANFSSLDNSGRTHSRSGDTHHQSSPTPVNAHRLGGMQPMEADRKMERRTRATSAEGGVREEGHYFYTSKYHNRGSDAYHQSNPTKSKNIVNWNITSSDNSSAPFSSYVNEDRSDLNRQYMRGGVPYENEPSAFAAAHVQRVRRSQAERHAMNEAPKSSLDDSSLLSSSVGTTSSGRESVLFDMDAVPVVPVELLNTSKSEPFDWMRHPRHVVLLPLLRSRGLLASRYTNLIEYHMSELFLHYIDLCFQGAYFIRYQVNSAPKERFFAVRMLPRNPTARSSEKIPHLVWTLHRTGVQVMGYIPLEQLVGITVNAHSASFRPHFLAPNFIKGPLVANHHLRLPIDGAFSLWFYDRFQRSSMSLDLLTSNKSVLDVWTNTFKGFVSVNSSSVVQMPLTKECVSVEPGEPSREARGNLTGNTQQNNK